MWANHLQIKNQYLQFVNKSHLPKYVSSSFIFTICLNSYYILEEVFLNITEKIFSNFPLILAVVEYRAADGHTEPD